jgi:hypothetical protein
MRSRLYAAPTMWAANCVRRTPRYRVRRRPPTVFAQPKTCSIRFRIRWLIEYRDGTWSGRRSQSVERSDVARRGVLRRGRDNRRRSPANSTAQRPRSSSTSPKAPASSARTRSIASIGSLGAQRRRPLRSSTSWTGVTRSRRPSFSPPATSSSASSPCWSASSTPDRDRARARARARAREQAAENAASPRFSAAC